MPEWVEEWPFVALWVFFWCGAMARGAALHGVGRLGRSTAARAHRPHRPDSQRTSLATRASVARAEVLLARWGAPLVSLSFFTVGAQSAVLIASGVLRMPPRRFVPALVVGAVAWATIYTTVGMAVVWALLGDLGQHMRWWLPAVALVVIVVVATRSATTPSRQRAPRDHPR